ncbi:hypothetical protein XHC_3089 [Xanthomonas hortorum pv. carotae str. M081]|nr:hypothetical protein XHC_3089 [Xanthomonas hortorum pv. carotae str. M081]
MPMLWLLTRVFDYAWYPQYVFQACTRIKKVLCVESCTRPRCRRCRRSCWRHLRAAAKRYRTVMRADWAL